VPARHRPRAVGSKARAAAERCGDGDGGERMSGGNKPGGNTQAAKTDRRKKLFLIAFDRKACNVTAACKASGITRTQLYAWRRNDPAFEAAFLEVDEQDLDFTESKLKKAIKNDQGWAICFHLKCKGKKRGWVERQEVTGADGVPLGSGVSEEEERRLRSLPLDDLKRIRDIIVAGTVPGAAAAPDRQADRGEEPPRVH